MIVSLIADRALNLGDLIHEIKSCNIFIYVENIISGYAPVFNEVFDHHSQEVTFTDAPLTQDDFYQPIVQIPGDFIHIGRPVITALNFFIGPVVIFF